PWFIVASNPEHAKLIRAARETNLRKTEWVIQRIEDTAISFQQEQGRTPVIACFGLAFKPDVDDLRESPALEIAHALKKRGHSVVGVEPNVERVPDLTLTSAETALKEADLRIFLVSHSSFKKVSIENRRW